MRRTPERLSLYKKFLSCLIGDTEWGKTDERRLTITISNQFKLTKDDIKTAIKELEEMKVIKTKKRMNGPTAVFLKRRDVG